jgi:hypothetical protein
MARVTLTPTALVPASGASGGGVADPAGTASVAGAGNGFTIAAISPNVNLWLRVVNASGSTGTISVLAGTQPLAISSGQGPVTVSLTTGTTQWVGPFDSSRVQQSDGSLTIETTQIMTVSAFTLDGRRV